MAQNKTRPTSASVDEFLSRVENPRRQADARKSLAMYAEITELPPVMWGPSIIGFGSQHYRYESGREGEMPLAGFSPRKANMTFYIDGRFDDAEKLFTRLGKHKRSVACLYINKLEDIDLNVLCEIISCDFAGNQRKSEASDR